MKKIQERDNIRHEKRERKNITEGIEKKTTIAEELTMRVKNKEKGGREKYT